MEKYTEKINQHKKIVKFYKIILKINLNPFGKKIIDLFTNKKYPSFSFKVQSMEKNESSSNRRAAISMYLH